MKKMNKQELQELQEMTGLLTEEQLNELKKAQAEYDEDMRAQAERMRDAWVGVFVKWGKTYGMIDSVHICPDDIYLGLVYASESEWVGRLVKENDVVALTNEPELRAACISAQMYFKAERESLRRYIARMKAEGKPTKTMEMLLKELDEWIKWIKKFAA